MYTQISQACFAIVICLQFPIIVYHYVYSYLEVRVALTSRLFLAYREAQQFLDFRVFLVVPIIKDFTIQIMISKYTTFHRMRKTR